MSTRPPERVDPWRLADRGSVLSGHFALADLVRLSPLLTSTEGLANYELAFDKDADGRPLITGNVRAALSVTCQRCLMPLRLEIDSRLSLTVVSGPEEAGRLPEDTDSVQLDEQTLSLRELVEDELLLNIPTVPRHDDCAVELEWPAEGDGKQSETAAVNPFAALAGLRGNKQNN